MKLILRGKPVYPKRMYWVRFKRIKGLSLLGKGKLVYARNRDAARRKFTRNFPINPKPKVTGITEIK